MSETFMGKHDNAGIDRRTFIEAGLVALGALGIAECGQAADQSEPVASDTTEPAAVVESDSEAPAAPKATVYITREISPQALVAVYDALGFTPAGEVAVKLSTGEPGGHNFLRPELIADLVGKVQGTIVECNTAHPGQRSSTESHQKAAEDHGFTAIAPWTSWMRTDPSRCP